MALRLFCFLCLIFFRAYSTTDYTEPQEVATTEGLPSSLVNQTVCAISGEYTDKVLDIVIPGPESLVINRVHTSHSSKPWFFKHQDYLLYAEMVVDEKPSYVIGIRQPSRAHLNYHCEKNKNVHKLKKVSFKLLQPKGLTNGATILSGKTNLKNQKVHFFPEEEIVEILTGSGDRKIFRKNGQQVKEEKINGSRYRYEGKGGEITPVSKVYCENQDNNRQYSYVEFDERTLDKEHRLQTITTSDKRKFYYVFRYHKFHKAETEDHGESRYKYHGYYLTEVNHPYAPKENYQYQERANSRDWQMTRKLRDEGRRFVNIDYYHQGENHVGGEIDKVVIHKDDDFRLDRVKKLQAPVGTDQTPITTHRFDYHATKIKKHKTTGHKTVLNGHTDVYDALNHKTKYSFDEEHRLISILRYSGTNSSHYSPYSEECYLWNDEGCLTAKIFKDGHGNVHHARTYTYDSRGNVLSSSLCGKLTGKPAPPICLDDQGKLVANGYESETKTYTYSDDDLNLLLSETDSRGKTIRYEYKRKSDRLKAKFISYDGKIKLREFYFYDDNHVLKEKIVDDGSRESYEDLYEVTERQITKITPRTSAPIGLPEVIEEWVEGKDKLLKKRSLFTYSKEGRLLKEQVEDGKGDLVYVLKKDYDNHGNLISETDRKGNVTTKKYDLATDNLIEECTKDVSIFYTYDFANRLIETRENHLDEELVTCYAYDYLGNCTAITNPYGHVTKQIFDDFGRTVEIQNPQVPIEGKLVTPIIKKAYDIAGFPISTTDANGKTTHIEVNIRGQATKITYPDGTQEKMFYSLDGLLMEKIDKKGASIEYVRDPLGRVTQEIHLGDTQKQTTHRYNAFHLLESTDAEGNLTSYRYELGRLIETVTNRQKTEQFYDSMGRLSEIWEHYGTEPHEIRKILKKYDLFDRIQEERLQGADNIPLHLTCYEYDDRGNRTLIQVGDQITFTTYNTRNQPIEITDSLEYKTHIEYNNRFINAYGQKVLQIKTTDPLGFQTIETYDAANRITETCRLNPLGQKVARQLLAYDLCGNQTKVEEDVIDQGKTSRTIKTLLSYNEVHQLIEMIEAAGTPEQKVTRTRFNSYGQKEALIKPNGIEILYTYDSFGRMKTLTAPDSAYFYEYNLLDQVTRVTDLKTNAVTKRDYFQKELIKETLANGLEVSFTYDRTGRAKILTFPDQTGIEYVYDAVDLKEIRRLGKHIYMHRDLKHTQSGEVLQAVLPGNAGIIDYGYDAMGRCLSIHSSSFSQKVPLDGFDAAGNLLKYERQNISYAFTYNDNYQLNSEIGHLTHTYCFDSVSNRTSQDHIKNAHNSLNQLIKKGNEELQYDLNGNLIRKGDTQYAYDSLDRLIKVIRGNVKTTYSYDSFNRRMSKNSNGEELFLYQGQEEIGKWKQGKCQEIRLLGKNKLNRTVALE